MLKFKIDIMEALKNAGVTYYSCRQSGLLSQSTFTDMRKGRIPATKSLDTICGILKIQPGDLIEWVPDTKEG